MIHDDDSFFLKFREWLARSRRSRHVEDRVKAIRNFSSHHSKRNPSFSLARLSSLYRASRAELLALPLPQDWLQKVPEAFFARAVDAYTDLLEFLEEILVTHRGPNMAISELENESRQDHLREMKSQLNEVAATRP